MDYNTLMIIASENTIIKINSCKELAHRMDHSKPKSYSVCPHQLQLIHDDCTVQVQWLSSVKARQQKLLDK